VDSARTSLGIQESCRPRKKWRRWRRGGRRRSRNRRKTSWL